MNASTAFPLTLEVIERTVLTPEIVHLVLRNTAPQPLPPFEAGAHIQVEVALASGARDVRSYSLINSESPGLYEIAVKREDGGRGGSLFMHTLQVGQRLASSLPNNAFMLHAQPHRATLIAGGIGITPILSMARTLQRRGVEFELHYAARHPDLMAFRDAVSQAMPDQTQLYFDQGPAPRPLDLAAVLAQPGDDRHVYVCGPKPLLDAVLATASGAGWAQDHVHFEVFGATAQTGDQPFTLVLKRSDKTLQVSATESVLDVMLAAGLDPMFDCKRGECGTCAVKVLDGGVDHRDYALSDSDKEEDALMCTCISRCTTGTLTLDA